ncbi:MAG: ABC transporter substrate-binding protein, partial [Psychromonas sp.]|nr:ABC transporter substrate-binding protein [Psychromonas sp.]
MRTLFCLLLIVSSYCDARTLIYIGVTNAHQPPFFMSDGTGLSLDISKALNKVQKDYLFVHKRYPTKRLQEILRYGYVDIVAFQALDWYENYDIAGSSCVLYHSKELFFSLKNKVHSSNYFDDIKSKRLVAVAGFH